MSKAKVMIAIPVHRMPHHRMDASLKAVCGTCQTAECRIGILRNESLISRARQTLVSNFVHSDNEWLYFWDDDIECCNIGGPGGNLIDMLLSHGKEFIGGLYATRGLNGHCAARVYECPRPDQRARLLRVKYLAGGSMLVHRNVVEKMIAAGAEEYAPCTNEGARQKSWAVFAPYIHEGEYLSEDYAFCQRWLDLGGEVWADLDVVLWHWGEAPFSLIDPRKVAAQ